MDLVYAFIDASQHYVGMETSVWNSHAYVFLWLLFHVEILIMGPQNEKLDNKLETINECGGRRMNLFLCGYIEQLWIESRQTCSRKPGMPKPPNREDTDKPVQDVADKDNFQNAYVCAGKPQMIATIDRHNRHIVTSTYLKQIHHG